MAGLEYDSDMSVLATDFPLPRDLASGSGIDKLRPEEVPDTSLEGDVLSCACPECGSPMAVRFWLMVADCTQCGCSIELSEEQEQEALRQMEGRRRRQEAEEFVKAVPALAPVTPAHRPPQSEAPQPEPAVEQAPSPATEPVADEPYFPPPPKPKRRKKAGPQPHSAAGRSIAALKAKGIRKDLEELRNQGHAVIWVRRRFEEMPAWLTSFVLHLVLIILLATAVTLPPPEHKFTLSMRISDHDVVGDLDQKQTVTEPTPFETPSAFEVTVLSPQDLQSPNSTPFNSPAAQAILKSDMAPLEISAAATILPGAVGMFDGRGQASRGQLVQAFGGTTASEASVTRGLKWMAAQQQADGGWILHGRYGGMDSNTAATALGLLPFLGAGQSHTEGRFKSTVERGLKWLIAHQKEDGDLRSGGGRMYAHAQCALALSEAYALTKDEQLKIPAQKAIDFIVRAQHPGGGWRYSPGEAGDTSVVGWQLMALRSASISYLKVPPKPLNLVVGFLDQVKCDGDGSRYSYQPGGGPTHVMTAEALLCRQYTGWPRDKKGLVEGTKWLSEQHRPDKHRSDMYYWYYATQVMHHQGGEQWRRWNEAMRDLLIETQETKGENEGSWAPRGGQHDGSGGRIYMTSLALLTLEVYYRHLPLYDKGAVDSALADSGTKTPDKSPDKGKAKKSESKKPDKKPARGEPGFDPLGQEAPSEK